MVLACGVTTVVEVFLYVFFLGGDVDEANAPADLESRGFGLEFVFLRVKRQR